MGIAVKQAAHAIADDLLRLPGDFPSIPDEVQTRFSSAKDWQDQQQQWWTKTQNSLSEFAGTVQDGIAMGNVLTVNGDAGAIYIRNIRGDGAWADPDTPFFVNRFSFFSLGSALTWNPDTKTLMVSGTIIAIAGTIGGFNIGPDYIRDAANSFGLSSTVTGGDDVRFWAGDTFANRATAPFRVTESGALTATLGTIGGWIIASTTLSKNNAVLDSAGQLALGTGNDIVILSATNATYRIWIGNAAAGSAAFTVTKAGVMTATNGVFSGTITSTSGTIGGFTIGATTLSAGSGGGFTQLSAGGSLTMGTVATNYAQFSNGGIVMQAGGNLVATLGGGTNGQLNLYNAGTLKITLDGGTGVISGNGSGITGMTYTQISGLGSMATQNSSGVAISGGTITGVSLSATVAIISSGSISVSSCSSSGGFDTP